MEYKCDKEKKNMDYYNNNDKKTKQIQTENVEFQSENISSFAHEFSSNTTLHGYRYLFAERGRRRWIWSLLMLCAICLAFYSFKDQVESYGSKTKTAVEMNDMETFDFPTVSFCLSLPTYSEKLNISELNITKEEIGSLYEDISQMIMFQKTFKMTPIVGKLKAANITSYRSFLSLFDMTVDDLFNDYLMECMFEGKKCQKSDFKTTLSAKGCVCITFNHYQKNVSSKQTEVMMLDSGLHMTLNMNSKKRLLDVPNIQRLFLVTHPYGHFIDTSMLTEFKILSPGTYNLIHIDEKEVNLLPPPYESQCGEKKLNLATEYTYSKSLCKVETILETYMEKCGCVVPKYEEVIGAHVPICNIEQFPCLGTVNHTKTCSCPRECKKKEYKTGLLSVELNYEEKDVYKRNNFIILSVKFRDSILRTEKQEPAVSLTDLLSGVGGGFGLFLGFSVLTFIEFLYFAWDVIAIWWRKKMSRKVGEKEDKSDTTTNCFF